MSLLLVTESELRAVGCEVPSSQDPASEEEMRSPLPLRRSRKPKAKKPKLDPVSSRPIPDLTKIRSKVFDHFKWTDDVRQWLCKYCGEGYTHASRGGSSSLRRHLESSHPEVEIEANVGQQKRKVMEETVASHSSRTSPSLVTEDGFNKHLISLIVNQNLPFSLVESEEFRNLISYCSEANPACSVPGKDKMKKMIEDSYVEEKELLKKELANSPGKISFVLDGWTSSNQHAFQGVIASWIDHHWGMQNSVIDLAILKGSHSGKNIAASFSQTLDDFELWGKLHAVTTDNASNMDTFFKTLDVTAKEKFLRFNSDDFRVRCLAHIACQSFLKAISTDDNDLSEVEIDEDVTSPPLDIIQKIRKGVAGIKASPQRQETYNTFCGRLLNKRKSLILDVCTRWNSTFAMLERVKEMKEGYLATVNFLSELKMYNITPEEWEKVDYLLAVLEPFRKVTLEISRGNSATIADTAGAYQILFEKLEMYACETSSYPEWLKRAATEGWKKLKKYYPTCDGLVYVVSTVLDPRLKLQYFKNSGWEPGWFEAAQNAISTHWIEHYKPEETNAESSEDAEGGTEPQDYLFQAMYDKNLSHARRDDDELMRYLAEPVVDPKILWRNKVKGAVGWWKTHQDEFPNLACMARDFLAVSGTGVPVERLFSGGPDLLDNRRQSMLPGTIQQCIFLRNWLKRKQSPGGLMELYMNAIKMKVLGEEMDNVDDNENTD